MVYHSNITDQIRGHVVYLGAKGKYSLRKIAENTGVSKSTVRRILSKSKNQPLSAERRGRPKKLSPRDRRHLLRSLFKLREKNPGFSIQSLVAYSGLQLSGISYRTFYRELRSEGFQYLQARKKGLVSRSDRVKRVKFARECKKILQNEPTYFHEVIAFYLDGVSFVYKPRPMAQAVAPKGKVWRKRAEGLKITAKGSKNLAGGKRLHLLVAIAYNRGVFFVEEYTKMNGAYFRDFVSRNFPVLFHGRECRKMFIMDNDPSQTSTMALKAIKDQAAQLFCIPARSPDLNPIENVFHIVKSNLQMQVRAQGINHETWTEFKDRVCKTLLDTSVDFINNLITSMPRRIDAVMAGKGYRTKY